MNPAPTITQCGSCRRFSAGGAVVSLSISEMAAAARSEDFAVDVPCGQCDCAAVTDANARREMERRARRHARPAECRPPAAQRAAPARENYRSPLPPEREITDHTPTALENDFQARGAADSANKILLEFFNNPKNFNRPFRSTDLEELTRAAGNGSSRMNNRAIWLREQFIPAGLYLDNDPNGTRWGLSSGSYYKLCRIEDATSLSPEKKLKLLNTPADLPRIGDAEQPRTLPIKAQRE